MEKKCRNVVSSSNMAGADSSSRAPILRMEDVLELDAVTPDPSDSFKIPIEDEESAANSGEDGEEEDQLAFVNPQVSFQIQKKSRFTKKKRKRKRLVGAEYNSFVSDEDLYVENAAADTASEDNVDGEDAAKNDTGKKPPDAVQERKPFYKKKTCACYEYRPKRTDLSRSQCKSCDSDVSNNDSIHSRYQVSSSESKKNRRRSVDPKMCNCYNREYIGKKYPRSHFGKSSQDNLQVSHSGFVYYFLFTQLIARRCTPTPFRWSPFFLGGRSNHVPSHWLDAVSPLQHTIKHSKIHFQFTKTPQFYSAINYTHPLQFDFSPPMKTRCSVSLTQNFHGKFKISPPPPRRVW